MEIVDNGITKLVTSDTYNMIFKRYKKIGNDLIQDGEILRWGTTIQDNPDFSPYGPEIAKIEISSYYCHYKSDGPKKTLTNMSLETYKKILDKINQGPITQITLDVTYVKDNPDLLNIMRYTLDSGCLPNINLLGNDNTLNLEIAQDIAELCGTIAVLITPLNFESALDEIELFTSLGVEQTNAHVVVSKESIEFIRKVLKAKVTDPRLKNMDTIVGLITEAKENFTLPDQKEYEELVHEALKDNIPIIFDSCLALRFLKAIDTVDITNNHKESLYISIDPCGSFCFSIYINVTGKVYSCRFCDGEKYKPIDLLKVEDFMKDVWMSKTAQTFRTNLLERKRSCPIFPEIDECLTQTLE